MTRSGDTSPLLAATDGARLLNGSDPIDQVLDSVRVTSRSFYYARVAGRWAVELKPSAIAAVHFLESGSGYVRCSKSGQVTSLSKGDLVIVPRGGGHVLGDQVDTPAVSIDDFVSMAGQPGNPQVLTVSGSGPETVLACGLFSLEECRRNSLWGLLPEVIVVVSPEKTETKERTWLANAFGALVKEATSPKPGSQAIIAQAIDLILQMGVRDWLRDHPELVGGWLAALRDPWVGRVIEAVHDRLESDWTLETMAALAGLSRSRFANLFTSLTGLTPASYVTQQRLWKALRLLHGNGGTLDKVAEQVGYSCGSSLRKAMVRSFGSLPRELQSRGR